MSLRTTAAYSFPDRDFLITLCLEYRQNYVQIYIGICRQGAGLGFRKSTPFYMGLPVL